MKDVKFVVGKEMGFNMESLICAYRGQNLEDEKYIAIRKEIDETLNVVSDKLGWAFREKLELLFADRANMVNSFFFNLGRNSNQVVDKLFDDTEPSPKGQANSDIDILVKLM